MRREYQLPLPLSSADKTKLDRWIKTELQQGRKVVHLSAHGFITAVSTSPAPSPTPTPEEVPQ